MKFWVRYDDEWVIIHPKQGMLAMPVDEIYPSYLLL